MPSSQIRKLQTSIILAKRELKLIQTDVTWVFRLLITNITSEFTSMGHILLDCFSNALLMKIQQQISNKLGQKFILLGILGVFEVTDHKFNLRNRAYGAFHMDFEWSNLNFAYMVLLFVFTDENVIRFQPSLLENRFYWVFSVGFGILIMNSTSRRV